VRVQPLGDSEKVGGPIEQILFTYGETVVEHGREKSDPVLATNRTVHFKTKCQLSRKK